MRRARFVEGETPFTAPDRAITSGGALSPSGRNRYSRLQGPLVVEERRQIFWQPLFLPAVSGRVVRAGERPLSVALDDARVDRLVDGGERLSVLVDRRIDVIAQVIEQRLVERARRRVAPGSPAMSALCGPPRRRACASRDLARVDRGCSDRAGRTSRAPALLPRLFSPSKPVECRPRSAWRSHRRHRNARRRTTLARCERPPAPSPSTASA